MQLAILTAVLAAIAAAEMGGGAVAQSLWRVVLVAGAALAAPIVALVSVSRLQAIGHDSRLAQRAAARIDTLVICVWLLAVGLILVVAQWPRVVRGNWQLAEWPLIDELLILLPIVGPLLPIWAAAYWLENTGARRDCESPSPKSKVSLGSYVWQQARHHLGLVLVPPLAVVGVLESFKAVRIAPEKLELQWWFLLPLLGSMFLFMPLLVRRLWHTTSLPAGPLRDSLEAVCQSRNCSLRDVLIWHTGGTMANAAIVGVLPWLRHMLLTDVLVARLTDDQLLAVARHELAHVRRWHLLLRLGALLLPVLWWTVIANSWPDATRNLPAILVEACRLPSGVVLLAAPAALLLYAVAVVGGYSRLLEHDADLDSALVEHSGAADAVMAASLGSALVTICGRGRASLLSNWLHPSTDARIQFLGNAIASRNFTQTFRARLWWLGIALATLYAAAIAVLIAG
jgi:Zn-dependent protease with chaperone function